MDRSKVILTVIAQLAVYSWIMLILGIIIAALRFGTIIIQKLLS